MDEPKYRIDKLRGRPTKIWIGSDSSGIGITINRKARTLHVSGWYDSMVGIEGADVPIDEIVALFGLRTVRSVD
jgi:hypothetical protein